MQSDRELLEMAARAAGIEIDPANMDTPVESIITKGGDWWNPLADDGDALRLAVKLRIEMLFTDTDIEAFSYAHAVGDDPAPWAIEELGADPYAATRRAITRAAAAIGQEKGG